MRWLGAIWSQLIGLFVDDGRFAALILGWIVLCAVLLQRTGLPPALEAGLLFGGLGLILVESAARRAKAGRQRE